MKTFELNIKDLLPTTTPLIRLAAYLEELAKLMGEKNHVCLDAIESGSLKAKVNVDDAVVEKVCARIKNPLVHRDSAAAHARLQILLAEDKTSAQVIFAGETILKIAPRATLMERNSPREMVSIRGKLISLGGKDPSVPFAIVEQSTGEIVKGNTTVEIAKVLAHQLFNSIEVNGVGNWKLSTTTGAWELSKFIASSFTPLKSIPIMQAVNSLRDLSNPTARNPLEILRQLREQ